MAGNRPVSTGKLLGGIVDDDRHADDGPRQRRPASTTATPPTGIATWAATKKQAAEKLGLQLRTRT